MDGYYGLYLSAKPLAYVFFDQTFLMFLNNIANTEAHLHIEIAAAWHVTVNWHWGNISRTEMFRFMMGNTTPHGV